MVIIVLRRGKLKRKRIQVLIISCLLTLSFIFTYNYFNQPLLTGMFNKVYKLKVTNNKHQTEIVLDNVNN